jgi:hypothetical protein
MKEKSSQMALKLNEIFILEANQFQNYFTSSKVFYLFEPGMSVSNGSRTQYFYNADSRTSRPFDPLVQLPVLLDSIRKVQNERVPKHYFLTKCAKMAHFYAIRDINKSETCFNITFIFKTIIIKPSNRN